MLKSIKRLKYLLVFLILGSCASTGNGEGDNGKSIMWLVEYENSKVYLFGSTHVADSSFYPLDSTVIRAFNESTDLSVEIDIEKVDAGEMMKRARYENNHTLEYNLSPENYAKIQEYLKDANIPEAFYNTMKPWLVTQLISMNKIKELGYDANLGLDKYFLDQARTSKRIHQLESVEIQLDMLEKLSKDPNEYVELFFEDFEDGIKDIEALFSAWKAGDEKALEKIMLEDYENDPKYNDYFYEMFTKRNIRMTKIIEQYLFDDKVHFVVVGAGHLVGKGSIVDLLSKKEMYKITKL
jgi:uncharacterized protein